MTTKSHDRWKNVLQENHDMSMDNHIIIDPIDIYYIQQIKNVRSIMPWIIISLGLIGNLLILMIFLKKKRRSTSNGFCFNALAISDIFALIFMLLSSLLTLKIVGNRAATCKIIRYLYHVSLQLSSWCLVLLSIDRLMAVCFIFKYNYWSKKWFAPKILAAIILTIILINIHLLIFVDAGVYEVTRTEALKKTYNIFTTPVPKHRQVYACYVNPEDYPFYFKYIYSYWDTFHAIVYGIMPFLIILACNIMIITQLTQLNKNKRIKKASFGSADIKPGSSKQLPSDPSIKSMQITIMLLSVAFVFLIFTSPISIYMATIFDNIKYVRRSKRELIKNVLRYIAYFNNAVNFYLYFTLSSEFRKEFIKLFSSKTLTSCTRTTELPPPLNNMLQNKGNTQINRRQLEFGKKKEYFNDESTEQPFLSESRNPVEKYMKNTRKAKLVHYNKNPNDWSTSRSDLAEGYVSNEDITKIPYGRPFINANATQV